MVGPTVVMFSTSFIAVSPEGFLPVEISDEIEEVEVAISVGTVVDFIVLSNGASVYGTDGKNKNDWGDGDNDVTGDLEAETTSSNSEMLRRPEVVSSASTWIIISLTKPVFSTLEELASM